ncbi:MAG: dihydroorotate dehydrogenase electron transfer subunit [Planctomycetes bacterium]|nr:dihydroorotate dehydrogenase electron transfer subunit [Planctomycetota bacterium]
MTTSTQQKGDFLATVSANRQIGKTFYRLTLEFTDIGAQAFAKTIPGQFAQLDLSNVALPPAEKIPAELSDKADRQILLRRPFSFCNLTTKNNKTSAEILYCVLGPATLRMTTLSAGNTIRVIGPLGNGFSVPENKKTALLVTGGMGAGPLLHLAKFLTTDFPSIIVTAFAGAKTAEDLPFKGQLDNISQNLGFSIPEFATYAIESFVATDDGSAGFTGFVTDSLEDWLNKNNPSPAETIIYSCGPEPMLAKLTQIAQNHKIDAQLSMERQMACGIGLCQSCAVECKLDNSNETVYKMCCKDGPVFDSQLVVFNL